MIKNLARAGIWLLLLLLAATACASPASQEPAAVATLGSSPAVEERTLFVETATALPEPTGTGRTVATAQPTELVPLNVETPEEEVSAGELQRVDGTRVDEAGGPSDEQQWVLDGLPSLGPAPELRNEVWLNSQPLRLAELRGKVVLLDMWTFG